MVVHDNAAWSRDVTTLAVDVGGSGIKASVLDAASELLVDRVRIDTPYPCPPELLVASIVELVADLPSAHRASVGFPRPGARWSSHRSAVALPPHIRR